MAGDWIKMRTDLQSHPKVVRILSALCPQGVREQSEKFRVIGGLHAVWSIFDAHSEDGSLKGYTPDLLDHMIGWQGFSRALESVGWLSFDGMETLTLPEFTAHNGQSAKRRGEDQKRKRDGRKSCPQSVRKVSDEMRTREEKRREDKKQEKRTRGKAREITLTDWIAELGDADAVPADDPIFDWAGKVGIPRDWIALAWWAFEGRYTGDGQGRAKTYADWRATFRNAVREDWLKLWRSGPEGCVLTTAGQQAQREMQS